MSFICFLILTRISEWAFMDFTFLSSNQKWKSIEFVEIETQTASQSDEISFFFFFTSELQSEDFFRFEFILHQRPVHYTAIRWNWVKVVLFACIWVPSDLPDWISVFLSSYCGFVDRFVMFISDIINKDGTIIQTSCE